MCATTAAGFGRRASSAASADSNFAPRPNRVRDPNDRTRQFSGRTSGSARSASTTTSLDLPGERAQHRHRRRQSRMAGIDLLGDEDEPHQ